MQPVRPDDASVSETVDDAEVLRAARAKGGERGSQEDAGDPRPERRPKRRRPGASSPNLSALARGRRRSRERKAGDEGGRAGERLRAAGSSPRQAPSLGARPPPRPSAAVSPRSRHRSEEKAAGPKRFPRAVVRSERPVASRVASEAAGPHPHDNAAKRRFERPRSRPRARAPRRGPPIATRRSPRPSPEPANQRLEGGIQFRLFSQSCCAREDLATFRKRARPLEAGREAIGLLFIGRPKFSVVLRIGRFTSASVEGPPSSPPSARGE